MKSSRSRNSDRERRCLAPCAGERLAEALDEQRAVGEPGEGSWNAWWVSSASNALRSLTSRALRRMPPTCSSPIRFVSRNSNSRVRAAARRAACTRTARCSSRATGAASSARAIEVGVGEACPSSAASPRTRSTDGLEYVTVPSGSSTTIRSLAWPTSAPKRASPRRRCSSSLSAALRGGRGPAMRATTSAEERDRGDLDARGSRGRRSRRSREHGDQRARSSDAHGEQGEAEARQQHVSRLGAGSARRAIDGCRPAAPHRT